MRLSLRKRLKSLLVEPGTSSVGSNNSQRDSPGDTPRPPLQSQNPVDEYYQHRLATNLPIFTRFAVQTRSLLIRDVFARGATFGRQDLGDLLSLLESHSAEDPRNLAAMKRFFDTDILLALADLLANAARNDLDTHAALQVYDFAYHIFGENVFLDHHRLQYVEALGEAGRYEDMEGLATEFSISELAPLQHELLRVQRKKSTSSSETWLFTLNQLYRLIGMSEIGLSDDCNLPLLDRLQSSSTEQLHGAKVTVIMPTFSPGPGIHTAVRSLLEQTWQNLEIIIVDDASPVEYLQVFAGLADLDSRIRIVHQSENAGAYVARNEGLALATGEYVITHDDDDWSHPDKIALQVRVLENDENVVATTSAHIRTTQDMNFQRVNMRARYMQMNYSSLMFRRTITEKIGPWDTVNRGGDSEFLTRVIENYGSERVVQLVDKPLSFSRVWAGSLTSGEMGRGYFAYSRLLYRWSFRQWQWDVVREDRKAIRDLDAPRPYAVPTTFEPGDRNKDLGLFDVIYVTDFFRQAKYVDFVMNEITTLQERGLRIGYMHLFSPQTDRPAGFPAELFAFQREGLITQVSHDDIAETKLLLVYDASIGMFLDQLKSSVVSRRSVVVDHELPVLAGADERSPTRLTQSLAILDGVFDTKFEAVGATPTDQQRLSNRIPKARQLADSLMWTTHLRQEVGKITAPTDKPIVGFHSYSNIYRWPANNQLFRSVYISSRFETKFYGHLQAAHEKFNVELFDQVDATNAAQQDELDFLAGIDFWVYHPHHRLEDQLWKPVLSAMRAGKVVILPERLQPIYGRAAVYAAKDKIESVISSLSESPEAYYHQAKLGQSFVAAGFDRKNLLKRIAQLLESPTRAASQSFIM